MDATKNTNIILINSEGWTVTPATEKESFAPWETAPSTATTPSIVIPARAYIQVSPRTNFQRLIKYGINMVTATEMAAITNCFTACL
jgi:transketolase